MVKFLLILGPLIAVILYALGDYAGIWDKLTGRGNALRGLSRLRSAHGFPLAFLYDDEADRCEYRAVERRISKRTSATELRKRLQTGQKPTLITSAGQPTPIQGVPPDWPQDMRFYLSSGHPILYCFGPKRGQSAEGSHAFRACSIGELETWLEDEKRSRHFLLGSVVVGMISASLLLLRHSLVQ